MNLQNIHTHMHGSYTSSVHSHNVKLTESLRMDSVFLLGEAERSVFFEHMMQSFGFTYVCLWSYLPQPTNCLLYLDGTYHETGDRLTPSSSSGSLANRLFNAYSESVTFVDHNSRIPGFSFKNNLPYMEIRPHEYSRMASSEVQLQFYQEARIKTIVFMGCVTGEIELGISTDTKVDVEKELRNMFPVDFSRQAVPAELRIIQPANKTQQPSSSSSSLRSLSENSEQSPLLFNIPATSFPQEMPREGLIGEARIQEALIRTPTSHEQTFNALNQMRNIQYPTSESVEATMTKAILAVLSSHSATSSTSSQSMSHKTSAFTRYQADFLPAGNRIRKPNMFRRAVSFLRNLDENRRRELQIQGTRPTTNQLQHMISERRRREKLNDSFQILRSLLPPGSKKDKATVLSKTTEYVSSLKSQVEELSKRNKILEARKPLMISETTEEFIRSSSSTETISVEMEHVSSSTSQERMVELRVRLRGECSMLDLVTRIMEFLKRQGNVTLVSLQTNTRTIESNQAHGITLRLKIEDEAFDESGFQEAFKSGLEDLSHMAHVEK